MKDITRNSSFLKREENMKYVSAFRILMVVIIMFISAGSAISQNYPTKPVRIMVGAAAGGGTDIMARFLAKSLAESFGKPFIVDNRASVTLAADVVAKAPPDGHTLLFSTATYLTNRALYKNLPYDPQRDLATISLVGSAPVIIGVTPTLPVASLKELVSLAKQKPGTLNLSSGGMGSPLHLAGALFQYSTKVNIGRVPYKGTAPAIMGLLTGEVQLTFASLISLAQYVQSGKAKVLAVMSPHRTRSLPDVPTTAEAGFPDLTAGIWYGFLATANTPKPIIDQLYRSVVKALETKDLRDSMLNDDVEPIGSSPEKYAAFASEEYTKWSNIIRATNFKVE
jgi:tripartite-type tricarboxylate transporter receptor subunit TctC